MSSVWSFAFLWCFESLAAGPLTEEGKKEKGMQFCQPTKLNASWILPILSHFHASLAIQPQANESHIMSEDRCQKSLNLLASNDLKCLPRIFTFVAKAASSQDVEKVVDHNGRDQIRINDKVTKLTLAISPSAPFRPRPIQRNYVLHRQPKGIILALM